MKIRFLKTLCAAAVALIFSAPSLNAQQSFSEVPAMKAVWIKSVKAGAGNAGYWVDNRRYLLDNGSAQHRQATLHG